MREEIARARIGGECSLELATLEEQRVAAVSLTRDAQRSLHLYTRDLEPPLYGDPEFVEALRRLALNGRRARIEILLLDPRRALRDGHRLIPLAQRLGSFMELRRIHRDYADRLESYLIADRRALLHRPRADQWAGRLECNAPLECRETLKLFERIWQQSEPEPELRRLGI